MLKYTILLLLTAGTTTIDAKRNSKQSKGSKAPAPALPTLNTNPDLITASGYSSGGIMTMDQHIIMSSKIKGVAISNSGFPDAGILVNKAYKSMG